jgi:hypothetical protein
VRVALLAEAYGKAGQIEKGLTTLTEGLETLSRIGWHMYEAELYRLRGELTLRQFKIKNAKLKISEIQDPTAGSQEAEMCFLKAIDIAQRQQAKSLELRAVMSFVRLRQQQAQNHATRITQHEACIRLDEAHQMLVEIYGWFTEGFDTKDLQDAKALLGELS